MFDDTEIDLLGSLRCPSRKTAKPILIIYTKRQPFFRRRLFIGTSDSGWIGTSKIDFRLLVYFTEKHLYDYKSQRFNKYNSQSYLVFNVKKNLDGVFSMECDFVKVLHPCKSVAHLVSWILNIYIYWKFGVGNIHINTPPQYI